MRTTFSAIVALGTLLASGTPAAADGPAGSYDWTGYYVGLHAGAAWLEPNTPAVNLVQSDSEGFAGGAYAGANWHIDNIVFGFEANGTYTDLSETVSCFNPAFACNAGSDWNASVRARVGYARGRVLIFATWGFAIADYNGYTRNIATGATFSDGETLNGPTAGGGVEYALTENIALRAEYRFIALGGEFMNYDVPYRVSPDMHTALLGASWKFTGL
jgi:outer membrane immunogenic protein